jgi:outer membrane protein assembly factor BamB
LLNKSLAVGIVFLFVFSTVTSMVLGYDIESEIQTQATTLSVGPMDSVWPMKSHDTHHTGRSPCSTADNQLVEKWRFNADCWVDGGPVIDKNGTIYFGSQGVDRNFYALYPNGDLKWKFSTNGFITSTPAIAEDGTIYIGDWGDYLHAINPDGTEKWTYYVGATVTSSPAIADDGTIYFGTMGTGRSRICAINPNGTKKWDYKVGDVITSDPVICDDGTVYIGSQDSYLYAMYPNGTLHWRFKTGNEIHGHPSIADDGTIYVGSYDSYLYALYPNGTLNWKFLMYGGTSSGPSIGTDGTIYVCSSDLYAISPNGTLIWSFDFGPNRWVGGSCPVISADGTIFVGIRSSDSNGGWLIAVNSDGTERWRSDRLCNRWVDSSPCIGEDGTVYIGCSTEKRIGPGNSWKSVGYLHAFGSVYSNEPPYISSMRGTLKGKILLPYDYWITAEDPDNNPVSIYVDWGDGTSTDWTGPGASKEEIVFEHVYNLRKDYTIKAKAKDDFGGESDWATLEVSMPKNKIINSFERFLDNHPNMFPILRYLMGL